MTVAELIALLEVYPQDMLIVLTRGRESDLASPLYLVVPALFVPQDAFLGRLFPINDPDEFGPQVRQVVVLKPQM